MELGNFDIFFKIVLLALSLFIPGYFLLAVIPRIISKVSNLVSERQTIQDYTGSQTELQLSKKESLAINFFDNELTVGEKIPCIFAASIFLLINFGFIVGTLDLGLNTFYNIYFITSGILLAIFFLIKRNYIIHSISNLIHFRLFTSSIGPYTQRVARSFKFNWFYIFPIIIITVPLFHLYAFSKLNWDAFFHLLKDSLAMQVSNSIQLYYPESIHPNDIPFILYSYLASSLYHYSIEILDLLTIANGNPTLLMNLTTSLLSYLPLVTLLVSAILLGTFASRLFKGAVFVVPTLIIFLMMPLLNHFFYIWSLYLLCHAC